MTKRLSLILGLSAAFSVGVLACSENAEESSTIECTSDADCAGNTDGKTSCDTANNVCIAPVTTGCTSDADCAGNTDGKTSCNTATGACVAPANAGCATNEDCASGLCENSVCATTKLANCTDPQIENAIASTESMVQVTFDAATNTWSEAAACPWLCNPASHQLNEEKTGCEALPSCTTDEDCRSKKCGSDGVCATQKDDVCKAYSETELIELNATAQNESTMVHWTYIESSDGTAGWVADRGCTLTECVQGYEYQEMTNTCEPEVTVCSANEDCAANDFKTWCEIPAGQNEGICIAPECQTSEQCTDETKPYCDPYTFKCTNTCLTDEQCVAIHGEGMICNWDTTTENAYTCIDAECEPGTCSDNGRKWCNGQRWDVCADDMACVDTGHPEQRGTCQIMTSEECSPACEDTQFCRDNGEAAATRYTCEWKAAQKSEPKLIISQVYIGGYGHLNTATYTNGFVELYNYGNDEIDLGNSKMAIIRGEQDGDFQNWINFEDECFGKTCKVAAKSYFRIKIDTNNVNGATPLTNNDLEISSKPSVDGSLAIVTDNSKDLTNISCNEVKAMATDLIGMHSAYCAEGSPASGIPGVGVTISEEGNRGTHSYQRNSSLEDTGDNYTDFEVKPVAPGKPL